jgi:hypothetical protein
MLKMIDYHSFATKKSTMQNWKHKSILNLMQEAFTNDPIAEIRKRARNVVLRGLENGWQGPPYNPIELARILKIDVTPNDSVIDARLVPLRRGVMQIQYNPFQKPTRINFSISHEIAHTLFSDCEEEVRNREEEPMENKQLEQLCNIAASEIQLPYAAFTEDANSIDVTIDNLIDLAKKYKASLESVFIRFTEVVDKPCGIVIGIFQNEQEILVDYYKSSRSLKVKINPGDLIPSDSKAYECKAPGWTARGIESWEIFNSNSFEIYSVGISLYRRDNRPRVGILIVPSNDVERFKANKITLEYGDATKPRGEGRKIIAQVVNTSGALGMGFGKSLAKNYPITKIELDNWHKNKDEFKLGESQLVKISENLYVFQMLAQKGIFPTRDGDIPLKYSSLSMCLKELAKTAQDLNASIHMPQIGAGQAKGDWNIITGMIHDELISKDLKVNIYFLPGKPIIQMEKKSSLTQFKEESTWGTGKLF